MSDSLSNSYLYLSYFLNDQTPLYGGGNGIDITPINEIDLGDTANTKSICLHNHSGTHIDFPNHFIAEGKTSEQYEASFWIFNCPSLFEYKAKKNQIINFKMDDFKHIPSETDFIIIKTDFGKYRGTELYWKNNPGFSPESAQVLRDQFPQLRVIGMDLISLTSYQNRELGRVAHRHFLGGHRPLLLVEDMDLEKLTKSPKKIICSPLMIDKVDGAPVTVIAEL
tara:strand:- start:16687 stop:17358 length:672 start_codon:yes stop_codon:yes gene_type:complete